jgi:hypothetical protein
VTSSITDVADAIYLARVDLRIIMAALCRAAPMPAGEVAVRLGEIEDLLREVAERAVVNATGTKEATDV